MTAVWDWAPLASWDSGQHWPSWQTPEDGGSGSCIGSVSGTGGGCLLVRRADEGGEAERAGRVRGLLEQLQRLTTAEGTDGAAFAKPIAELEKLMVSTPARLCCRPVAHVVSERERQRSHRA